MSSEFNRDPKRSAPWGLAAEDAESAEGPFGPFLIKFTA